MTPKEYLVPESEALKTSEPTDEEILAASIKQPKLFGIIVDRYHKAFLRKAVYVLKNNDEAEDVVQDTFVKMYKYAHTFTRQEGAQFSSWAYRILLNTCYTYCKKNKRDAVLETLEEEMAPGDLGNMADSDFEKFLTMDEFMSVLKKIPATAASLLSLHVLQGKTHEDIADKEGVSVGTVRVRMHRAKQIFKKML